MTSAARSWRRRRFTQSSSCPRPPQCWRRSGAGIRGPARSASKTSELFSGRSDMLSETISVTRLKGLDIPGLNLLDGLSPGDILQTMQRMTGRVLRLPKAALNREMEFAGTLLSILAGTAAIEAEKGDRRFADPIWNTNPFYR